MDAVKFIKERKRMCNGRLCATCPLFAVHQLGCLSDCKKWCMDHPEASVTVVEKWAEEHPRKTRQSDFLRLFPQVMLTDDGIIDLCPSRLSENYRVPGTTLCGSVDKNCRSCLREFWGQEVE